ncbi:MAG: TonB-dependent receptor [Ferruginibacter sp.]|nr:TonB-dependent receptor [Cytophagales bacterium]
MTKHLRSVAGLFFHWRATAVQDAAIFQSVDPPRAVKATRTEEDQNVSGRLNETTRCFLIMPFLRPCFSLWCLLAAGALFPLSAPAQRMVPTPGPKTAVSGLVQDSNNQPIPGAAVRLLRLPDSAAVAATQTEAAGQYRLAGLAAGSYLLRASAIGLKPATTTFTVGPGQTTLNLPPLRLPEAAELLREVTVRGQQQRVEAGVGKVVYNVEAQLAAAGTSAFEVLQRTPGVSVSQEENILLKGNANVNVMLDGKLTYLSPQQLSTFLKGTPAENLARVEIITAPSAQYDAAGSAGLINIVTKKSARRGYALNVTAGAGTGHNPQTTEALIGNVKTARFNLFGNYGYNYKSSYLQRTSYRIIDNGVGPTAYDRASFDPSTTTGHSYKAGLDFKLGHNQEAGLVYSGFSNAFRRDAGGPTTVTNLGTRASEVVQNRNTTREPSRNNSWNLNYKVVLDTTGRQLTLDADYARYANNSRGTLGSQRLTREGIALQPDQELAFEQPVRITIRSVKSDVVWPVRIAKLTAGLKYSFVTSDNNFRYDSLVNNGYAYAPTLSNHFVYQEHIQAAYASASRPLSPATTLEAGLRVERTRSSGRSFNLGQVNERNYTYLFPSVSLSRRLTGQNNVSVSLTRRINRPVYGNLNPSRYFFDKFSYYQGNPYLQPETSWNASATLTYQTDYILTLGASRTNRPIADFAQQNEETAELVVGTTNFSRRNDYDALLIVPIKLTRFWEMQNTLDLRYLTYDFRQGTNAFTPSRLTLDVMSTHTLQLPWNITMEVSVVYTSPSLNGVYVYRHYFTVDGGWKKSLAHKKLDARLSFTDLFNTIHYWGYSIYEGANIRYNHRGDNRRVNLSLTYRFGGQLTAVKARAVEEAGRVK